MQKRIVLAVLALAITLFLYFLFRVPGYQDLHPAAPSSGIESLPKPTLAPKETNSGSGTSFNFPNRQKLREEAASDPHSLAPSLVRLSADLARKMGPALDSIEEARVLIQQFEKCVDPGEDIAETVQAMCLSNAKVLAEKHPSLGPAYSSMLKRANPDVVRRANR